MDEAALRRVEQDLLAWGLAERSPALSLTRRFRGALARAAAASNEAGGPAPTLEEAALTSVRRALASYALPADARIQEEHVRLLAGIELASLLR